MRRASASRGLSREGDRKAVRLRATGILAGVLVAAMAVGAPALAFAEDGTEDDNSGQLSLNTAVLVNETVGSGSTGDFAIRGALFSRDLVAKVETQRSRAAERLRVVEELEFARPEVSPDEFRSVRSELFHDYSQVNLETVRDDEGESPVFSGLAVLVAVPLVVIAGVLLGRFWVRRKRGTP